MTSVCHLTKKIFHMFTSVLHCFFMDPSGVIHFNVCYENIHRTGVEGDNLK